MKDPELPLHLLSVALIMASVLPMLVYSFAKDLLEHVDKLLDKGKIDKHDLENKSKKIFSFYASMDFITTESALFVFLSGLFGGFILIFTASDSICRYKILGYLLIGCLILYLIFAVFISFISMCKSYRKKDSTWRGWWKYCIFFYPLISIVTGILGYFSRNLIIFSEKYRICPEQSRLPLSIIVAVMSMFLIFYSICWIFPSISYQPLWHIKENIKERIDRWKRECK